MPRRIEANFSCNVITGSYVSERYGSSVSKEIADGLEEESVKKLRIEMLKEARDAVMAEVEKRRRELADEMREQMRPFLERKYGGEG